MLVGGELPSDHAIFKINKRWNNHILYIRTDSCINEFVKLQTDDVNFFSDVFPNVALAYRLHCNTNHGLLTLYNLNSF